MKLYPLLIRVAAAVMLASFSMGASRPDMRFPVFQFPQDAIPRIDGEFGDWEMVPESYAIGLDQLKDTERGRGGELDPKDFDVSVKVAWVQGLNRLYFYYRAYDDFWEFGRPGLRNDIFEVVVDGDLSGGKFINRVSDHKNVLPESELHFKGHGSHAQNYHIFTPVKEKDWAMVWGNTPWIKDFPYANATYYFDFEPGDKGVLEMEFYITLFDHADMRGPGFSTESNLEENALIGLSWCILEYDEGDEKFSAFMNLAHDTEMIRNASKLCIFELKPIEAQFRKPIEANWSSTILHGNRRLIAFSNQSYGKVDSFYWDFGDGNSSTEQNPIHHYQSAGRWIVTLTVNGPQGSDKRTKVWEVVTP